MRGSQRIVLGSRGSELSRAQTSLVEGALRAAWPELEIEVQIITTAGDRKSDLPNESIDPPAGRKGLFTSEIEQALQRREIDVGVHSAKDLPSEAMAGIEICATLPRAAVEDALIMKEEADLASLRSGATVATGSVRRQHQLRWRRPDLRVVGLRGNVPTRLRKLIANEWDAIILAHAGLVRLGHDLSQASLDFDGRALHLKLLPIRDFLPAGGQGVIAVQVRNDDDIAKRLAGAINHPATLSCLRAEREFLRLLRGDCGSPVGVLATIETNMMRLGAQVFDSGSSVPRSGEVSGSAPELLPAKLMEQLDVG